MAVIERQVESEVVAPLEESFWSRPLIPAVPIERETIAFVGLVLLAALLRFWDLGSRMLHHDESLHAVYSWYLYIGKGYVHDPMMHGPFLFELNALVYFLLGATDATARVAPALFGTVLVGLPYFLRDRIGRSGALVASLLLMVSPTILYYSRFIRHDIYQIFFMTLLVIATFRYLAERKTWYLYFSVGVTSLAFSDKEDTYFLMAILLTFLLFLSGSDVLDVILRGKPAVQPATDVLVLLGTLILPLFSALPYFVTRTKSPTTIDIVFTVSFAILFAIGAAIGLRWNRHLWTWSAVLFWTIFIVLYTTFFSNPGGVYTGIFGALRYWIDQQGVARGGQPWFYYLVLLPMYEFLAVGVGLVSIPYWIRHRTLFTDFLLYWAATSMVLWGWASEKMPWMVIEMSLPFILLAATTLGRMLDGTDWKRVARGGGLPLGLTLILAIVAGAALLGQGSPLDTATPINLERQIFQWVVELAVFVGLVYLVTHYWTQVGSATAKKVAGYAVVLILFAFTVRAAWQVNYYHGDIPVEMLIYTQTSPDVGLVMNQINDIAYRTGQGKSKLQVAYDADVAWPFEWYLRDYTSRVYIGTGNPPTDAPVILVGTESGHDVQVKQLLGNKYVSQRYRLRWWFPEDTYRTLTIPGIVQDLLNPADRASLWRFILYRQTPTQLGSTDFVMFVRRDLAYGAWSAPQAQSQTAQDTLYQQHTKTVTAIQSYGNTPALKLNAPRGVAADSQGNLYIADSGNNRIVEVSAAGQVLHIWGSAGTGPGQFNEPWGIAVAPSGQVYVADTWNHRVQEFNPNGTFVRSWGSQPVGQPAGGPGQFFGPRAVAIDSAGNVYVTDTGNKRIEKFTADGKFLATYGSGGAGLGQFNEPVGLAIDKSGNFYVADTWNQRIEKFNANFQPITSWPILGWDSQSVVEKPYLAVDSQGNVYATDPEANHVVEFNSNGQLLAVFGKAGSDLSSFQQPVGIAADSQGDVFVADSQNGRILKFGMVP